MSTRRFFSTVNNTLIRISEKVNAKNSEQETPNQKINVSTLISAMAIVLPLSAFVYWRLFIDYFYADYFSFCYSIEDVAYILYEKGTYIWYLILLLSVASWVFLIRTASNRILFGLILTVCLEIIVFALATIGKFSIGQTTLYMVLLIVLNAFIFLYNRNAFYGYIMFFGLFLITSANKDAMNALNHAKKMTLTLKTGEIIVTEMDTTKIYIGSTSKFVLIFDKNKKALYKYARESVK